MVRAALASKRRVGQGPRPLARFIPAISVVCASLLHALPIVSLSGWYPDFGFLALIAWRLLRSDAWPGWWAAPLGLINDAIAGYPIGLSVFIWSAAILALDLLDRRTMWRDYWVEWALAGLLLLANSLVRWRVSALVGADVAYVTLLPHLVISLLMFPVVARIISNLDRWRLGR